MKATALHHCGGCGHHHGDISMLDRRERWILGGRLVAALVAAGLLLLALAVRWWRPDEAELSHFVSAAAAILVGVPVLIAAARSLREPGLHGATDLLVAIAMIAAWVVGDLETAALVPLAMVIGHAIEERSLLGSREALAALADLTRGQARRLDAAGNVAIVDGDALMAGERIELRPGDRCPADGVVESGSSCLDTSPITGESVPQDVLPGDRVLAGAVNLGGHLIVLVERAGATTALGGVVALMQDAEQAKPEVTRLLDRFAGTYLLLVVLAATLLGFATGSASVLMATLVAACPCALVVAAPATAIAAIAAAARHGILVKGTAFLEHLATCDCVIFDKTGTLTEGDLRVINIEALDSRQRRLAASLGQASSHPVAHACAALVAAGERLPVADLHEDSGQGLRGSTDGAVVLLGRSGFLATAGVIVPEPPAHDGPIVGLAIDGSFIAWLLMRDTARPEAQAAVRGLRELGLDRQILCTGDRRIVAERIAAELELTEVEAEALPATKLARVRAEIAAGHQPVVVGDGINDSLALKAGAVGVAIGGRGADVAIASADIALVDGDLRRLVAAVRLSRACRSSIILGIGIACLWTVLVVALAAAGILSPFGAAILHNVGTIAVIINAGRIVRSRVDGSSRGRDHASASVIPA